MAALFILVKKVLLNGLSDNDWYPVHKNLAFENVIKVT